MRQCLLVTLLLSLTLPAQALAGTVVVQKVESTLGGQKTKTRHLWSIDGGKFQLAVESSHGKTVYLFNGRTFYVCSQLDSDQLALLSKNHVKNPEIIAKFKSGACQTVPSNFMTRFFLSPAAAVESIDQFDGLKLTIALKNYELAPTKKTPQKIEGRSCVPFVRSYKIIKMDESVKRVAVDSDVSENFCEDADITWRKDLWREVAKAVMRQPKGGHFMNQLRADHAKLSGFILQSDNDIEISDGKGRSLKGRTEVRTIALKEQNLSPKLFQIPIGYTVFSPENVMLAVEDIKEGQKTNEKVKKDADILDTVQSVFFCAISGGLGCFKF